MTLIDLLKVARGDAPADLLLRGGRIVNVFSGEIEETDVAIYDGKIAGIGSGYTAKETIDLAGAYVAPGLIDAHVHIESSLCVPAHFASAVLPRGITTVVTDPHEIANVAGVAGVRFMAAARAGVPLNIEIMAPSCVPATPMGSSGATLDAGELQALLDDRSVFGLAEVMNFPGVIHGVESMLAKLAPFAGLPVDGHCPAVRGLPLNAYVASGIGSDHESTTVDEAREKLARGLHVFLREATNARNLQMLLPLITPANSRRVCFCTDDRQPADLLDVGSVDHMLRVAIEFGLDPVEAFRLVTLNPAEYFGFADRGAIAPGRRADLFLFDDLKKPVARRVWVAGQPVETYVPTPTAPPPAVLDTCRVKWEAVDFRIAGGTGDVRVIESLPDQLVTNHCRHRLVASAGELHSDPAADVLKIAVIERHHGTGNIGLGFIRGFGLNRGAIAGTVAHDHHNLIVIGVDDESMMTAARGAAEGGGGLAVADGSRVVARLALPVAGLMSDRPVHEVRRGYDAMLAAARSLGSAMHDPFMAMSFMALEVIPSLKLTDQGLIDVDRFEKVQLSVGDDPAISSLQP